MIGVLIVTHRELAEALISVCDLIMGHQETFIGNNSCAFVLTVLGKLVE